jgi:hypothetical protein
VALRASAKVHLVLEGTLRALPRQACIQGTRGPMPPLVAHPEEHEDREGGLKGHHPSPTPKETESFVGARSKE